MKRPYKRGATAKVDTRLPPALKAKAKAIAEQRGITLSRWIVRQIRRGVERAGRIER
jgi:predicted HicB family RNase H-like nuclease